MLSVRRNVDEIARLHVDRFVVVLEEQFCFALQDDDPFGLFLIVPRPIRTGVVRGDDPLDADLLVLGEEFDQFLGEIGRQVGEEVVPRCADAPVMATFIASIDSLANCFCFLRTYG